MVFKDGRRTNLSMDSFIFAAGPSSSHKPYVANRSRGSGKLLRLKSALRCVSLRVGRLRDAHDEGFEVVR